MTLPTGVQAVAENNYGRPDRALEYLQRMTRTFSYALPGSIYEVSPDYGMTTQAWNIYSYAVPVITQFFGINPQAAQKTIYIRPQMPSAWDHASIENVVIGENMISMFYERGAKSWQLQLEQSRDDWKIFLAFPEGTVNKWQVNGKERMPKLSGKQQIIEVSGKKIKIELTLNK